MATAPSIDAQQDPTRPEAAGASPGQILIMFALFLTGMMGMLGLATDVGFAFAQRRTVQNAADAGALAGARAVAHWTADSPIAAGPDVAEMVAANRMNTTPTVSECVYVDDANAVVGGNCAATVPAAATGVRVTAEETHGTFFISVVPGAPESVTVSATATAHARRWGGFPGVGPFIVCGPTAWWLAPGDELKLEPKYTAFGLLNEDNTVNTDAIGETFRIHDHQLGQDGAEPSADCGLKQNHFKGNNNGAANVGKGTGEWFDYFTGTIYGWMRLEIDGHEAYGASLCVPESDLDDCVAVLPIATNEPAGSSDTEQLFIVTFAVFYITEISDQQHDGRLLDVYVVGPGPGESGWTRDDTGPVIIRLTA